MKTKLPAALALVAVFAVAAAGLDDETDRPAAAVDLTPVLAIGDFTVSRYLFEKAHDRFLRSGRGRAEEKPDTSETAQWFRLYLAQQVIKADLTRAGQLDRPEVQDMTARMTRYMLVQPRGVLYRKLGGADPTAFHRERRARILRECGFTASPEHIARLWASLAPIFSRGVLPSEAEVAAIASTILAHYSFGGAPRPITAADFVRDFRQAIARMAPRDANGLREQIEDIAVAEHDLAEAKELRLDETPQFREDRRNFALNQALALHEQEVLSSGLTVTPAEVRARYEASLSRYASPSEVSGTLFVFSKVEDARRGTAPAAEDDAKPDEIIDPFVLRRDGPSLLAGVPFAFLVSAPPARRYGPFPFGDKYAVFLKRATGEATPRPFAQVQPEIHRQLLREKLDALELEHLARNAGRVRLLLDPARYGLPDIDLRARSAHASSRVD